MQQTRLESQTWTPSVQRWRLHVSSGHVETSALNRLNEVFCFELFEMKTCCWNTELLVFSVPWLEKVSVYVSWLHNSLTLWPVNFERSLCNTIREHSACSESVEELLHNIPSKLTKFEAICSGLSNHSTAKIYCADLLSGHIRTQTL